MPSLLRTNSSDPPKPHVWWTGDEPPTHWTCPHDKEYMDLEDALIHIVFVHDDCFWCACEAIVMRRLVDMRKHM